MSDSSEPRHGTIEAWALAFVRASGASEKLQPAVMPALDDDASWTDDGVVRRVARPGRPAAWRVTERASKAAKPRALARVEVRARMLHRFAHHELQAAELFAWALLAFPQTPRAFRAGLMRLCAEELEHMHAYVRRLEALGGRFGDQPIRDWFWQRVAACSSPLQFVALQGIGLEGANLEHAARWAQLFRAAGDETSAVLIDRVEREEIGHVAFARHWFERFSDEPLSFARWSLELPAPLTPALFRGALLNLAARRRAGFDDEFLARLAGIGPAVRPKAPTP